MKALSLQQPWAWLMTAGPKRIENRKWRTNYRGPVLVHASKGWDKENFQIGGSFGLFSKPNGLPFPDAMPDFAHNYERGGIVGIFTITDCVTESEDPWFFGPYGFVVKDARPLPFVPCRGMLNLFDVPLAVLDQLNLEETEGRV